MKRTNFFSGGLTNLIKTFKKFILIAKVQIISASSQKAVGPSERNPVRTKASFDLTGHMFSFCWAFVPMGFRSSGTALFSVLPTDCNEIYYSYCKRL